jgi:hypothetical protein
MTYRLRSWRERVRDFEIARCRKHLTVVPDPEPEPALWELGWGMVPTPEEVAEWKAESATEVDG